MRLGSDLGVQARNPKTRAPSLGCRLAIEAGCTNPFMEAFRVQGCRV